MNKTIIFFLVTLSASLVHAAPLHSDLCLLDQRETSDAFQGRPLFDAGRGDNVEAQYVEFLERGASQILNRPLTLEKIKEIFAPNGEEQFNDLYMSEEISNLSGRTYVEVMSYPGDNPYGLFFDVATKTIVGAIEDGDYSIIVDGKKVYCSDIK